MRVVFTIIFNGLHHLKNNDQYLNIINNCDKWIVVEGASLSKGSTYWCGEIAKDLHNNGASVDGTCEFMVDIAAQHDNVVYIPSNGFWESKDVQVNRAIQEVKKFTDNCYLWQVDIDEQWKGEDMTTAERCLGNNKVGKFFQHCLFGPGLKVVGVWGEGIPEGTARLWRWEGEEFRTHEPPILETSNTSSILLPQRYTHYNYYFEKDVKFKEAWYGGHDGIFDRWKAINNAPRDVFPLKIDVFLKNSWWGQTNTWIVAY